MAAIKVPQFFEGGISTDGALSVDGNATFKSRVLFGENGTLTVPAGTGTSGTQYQVRYNPSSGSLELFDDAWKVPFSSAIFYDEDTQTFKLRDSNGDENTVLTLTDDATFSLASKVVSGAGTVSVPSFTFDGHIGSGVSCDDANGSVIVGVNQRQILTAKPTGITVRNSTQTSAQYIADFDASGSEIVSDLNVTGDLGITGQLTIGGQVVSTQNITAFSDKRIKDIKGELTPEESLAIVNQLKTYLYYNKLSKHEEIGLIADEVNAVAPVAVRHTNGEVSGFKDLKSLDIYALVAILWGAVQALGEK